jgi:hypothetical protein
VDTLGPALQSLLDAANEALIECYRPVGLVTLAPGNNVAWDNCCGYENEAGEVVGGQLWTRVVSVLPQPQQSQTCDITDLQVRVAVGVVRCMHCLDDEGAAPTAAEMTADTLGMTKDADILLRAIREWSGTSKVVLKTLRVEQGLPLGPQGCCGGWEWTLVFRLLMCGGC